MANCCNAGSIFICVGDSRLVKRKSNRGLKEEAVRTDLGLELGIFPDQVEGVPVDRRALALCRKSLGAQEADDGNEEDGETRHG